MLLSRWCVIIVTAKQANNDEKRGRGLLARFFLASMLLFHCTFNESLSTIWVMKVENRDFSHFVKSD